MSNEPDWLDKLYAEGGDEQPPAALDDRIRAASRQPVRRHWYSNPARLATLATAASLVIAASIIYFEPFDASMPEAPGEIRLDEAVSAPGRADPVRIEDATVPAEREARQEAQMAAEAPSPPPAAARETDELQSPAVVGATAGLRSMKTRASFKNEDVRAELERLCGPLPGTEDERRLQFDGSDWLVIVGTGEDALAWQCVDGAWIGLSSEEQ